MLAISPNDVLMARGVNIWACRLFSNSKGRRPATVVVRNSNVKRLTSLDDGDNPL